MDIAEKMGALTSTIMDMKGNNDVAHNRTLKMIEGYCKENERQHERIFIKLGSHGSWINRMKGSFSVIVVFMGWLFYWIKSKFGN